MIDWKDILANKTNLISLVKCTESEIDNLSLNTPPDEAVQCYFMRGKRCATEDALLNEMAASLQFPYYFGHNWDAADECIDDLDWLPHQRIVLVITEAEKILASAPDDYRILIEILADKVKLDARKDEPRNRETALLFQVVFQCDGNHYEQEIARLNKVTHDLKHNDAWREPGAPWTWPDEEAHQEMVEW